MKILVTGAAGFLGSELVERLLARGIRGIRCFVRPGGDCSRLDALVDRYGADAIDIATGTLNVPGDIAAAMTGVDVVYHLAAAMKGSAADMFLSTVVGSKNLLEVVAERPATRVILVSSMGVYGVAELPAGTLVDEHTPLESQPARRDPYSFSKWRQETLFREYQARSGFPLIVLRPGVIYGAGGAPLSSRVGVSLFGLFLHMGRRNSLPLCHVTNCAEAITVAGTNDNAVGQTYNVVDDDLPTCAEYLQSYRRSVRRMPYITLPYRITTVMSRAVESYSRRSQGQLPAVFTRYKTASIWKGNRFTNEKLKALGWRPIVPTAQGLAQTWEYWREQGAA